MNKIKVERPAIQFPISCNRLQAEWLSKLNATPIPSISEAKEKFMKFKPSAELPKGSFLWLREFVALPGLTTDHFGLKIFEKGKDIGSFGFILPGSSLAMVKSSFDNWEREGSLIIDPMEISCEKKHGLVIHPKSILAVRIRSHKPNFAFTEAAITIPSLCIQHSSNHVSSPVIGPLVSSAEKVGKWARFDVCMYDKGLLIIKTGAHQIIDAAISWGSYVSSGIIERMYKENKQKIDSLLCRKSKKADKPAKSGLSNKFDSEKGLGDGWLEAYQSEVQANIDRNNRC